MQAQHLGCVSEEGIGEGIEVLGLLWSIKPDSLAAPHLHSRSCFTALICISLPKKGRLGERA